MHKFFKAVAFVTIFSVLTRAMGFFLRIYLSRVMGAEALGAYQVSVSIFGVLMTLISSGLPLVVSRNVAFYNNQNNKSMQNKNITAGLIISVAISVILCAVLFAFPNILKLFINSDESISIILVLLPALVASAIYAILRGGLWGKKCFFTISFTEFFEQVARIIICIILFSIPMGISVGQKTALSLTLSCVVSALLVAVLYFVFGGRFESPKTTFSSVLKTSTPITLVRTLSSVLGSLIAIIIPARLMAYGYTQAEALAQFGIIMGMTMPIIMIPNTFVGSIAVALVPELSGHTNNIDKYGVKNLAELSSQVTSAITTTIVIAFILMSSFISLGKPIGVFLFNNAQAGEYLMMGAVLMLPMCLNQICTSMLNAIGLELKGLGCYAVGAVALFISIIFLPKYIGAYSVLVGLGLMHTITCILGLKMLKKRKLINWSFFKTMGICALICAPTALLGTFVYNLFIKFTSLFVSLAVSGILTVIFTILLMFVFNIADIKVLLAKIVPKRLKKHKRDTFNLKIKHTKKLPT